MLFRAWRTAALKYLHATRRLIYHAGKQHHHVDDEEMIYSAIKHQLRRIADGAPDWEFHEWYAAAANMILK